MVYHWVCDAWPVDATPDLYGYQFPTTCRTSPPFGLYQFILLGDRGTCVWTTCPGSLREAKRPGLEHETIVCKSDALTTIRMHQATVLSSRVKFYSQSSRQLSINTLAKHKLTHYDLVPELLSYCLNQTIIRCLSFTISVQWPSVTELWRFCCVNLWNWPLNFRSRRLSIISCITWPLHQFEYPMSDCPFLS